MSMNITSNIKGASPEVVQAIKHASQKTGVDFDYLINQARAESSFKTDAKASTSSATGLYQFIDQTWLSTVSRHGSKHGLDDVASQIKKDFQGRYFVPDDVAKEKILNLRTDPKIASVMAAEFASDNQNYLEAKTGKEINSTDLYFAHFLGAGGASKFIKAMQDAPYKPAAYLLPAAASANRNIFYNSDGSARTFDQIYKSFEQKFNKNTKVQMASVETIEPNNAVSKKYNRDISFERMYGQNVTNFVRDLPTVSGFENGQFFNGMFGNDVPSLVQNQVMDMVSFLTLTSVDLPK